MPSGYFDEEEMRLLIELAEDISFALDHIGKAERLRYLASFDPLTGLREPQRIRGTHQPVPGHGDSYPDPLHRGDRGP